MHNLFGLLCLHWAATQMLDYYLKTLLSIHEIHER